MLSVSVVFFGQNSLVLSVSVVFLLRQFKKLEDREKKISLEECDYTVKRRQISKNGFFISSNRLGLLDALKVI